MKRLARLAGVAIAGAVLAAGTPAGGAADRAGGRTILVGTSGRAMPPRWQRWVRRSLVPVVNGRIKISLRGCPGSPRPAGCVFWKHPSTIYLNRGLAVLPATLYHELGHFYDWRVL